MVLTVNSAQNKKNCHSEYMGKQKITMTIDEKTFSAFKRICTSRAMKVSSKVELMMQEFIEAELAKESPITSTEKRTSKKVELGINSSNKHSKNTKEDIDDAQNNTNSQKQRGDEQ